MMMRTPPSTILHDRIIHDGGFTPEDNRQCRPAIFSNTVQSMVALIRAMTTLDIPYGDPDLKVTGDGSGVDDGFVLFLFISASVSSQGFNSMTIIIIIIITIISIMVIVMYTLM